MMEKALKRVSIILVLFIFASQAGIAGVIALEGNYQGKNLYVQNPFAGSGVGFCTFEVTVNGDITTDEINSSAFEVDLSNFDLKIGDPLVVKIKHKDDCKPKVLNPEVLKPKSTFEIQSIDIGKDSILKWTTKGETGQLPFIIEQYRWNKWVQIGEVPGEGTPSEHTYEFKVTPHSGENKFRVKQVDYTGKARPSKSVKLRNTRGEEIVTFSPKKVRKKVIFSKETMFEIYDQYGNIVKKGFAKEVNAENLKEGIYYLSYDNKTEEFIKK